MDENLSGEHDGSTSLLDLLLSSLRNQLGLHNQRLRARQHALTQHLEVAELGDVEQWGLVSFGGLVLHILGYK